MTESEAKTKWCPMVRVYYDRNQNGVIDDAIFSNRETTPRCIGSGCMMWRKQTGFRHAADASNDAGFCGLAGSPNT